MCDQIRAIDNTRFLKKIGSLSSDLKLKLKEDFKIDLDL